MKDKWQTNWMVYGCGFDQAQEFFLRLENWMDIHKSVKKMEMIHFISWNSQALKVALLMEDEHLLDS